MGREVLSSPAVTAETPSLIGGMTFLSGLWVPQGYVSGGALSDSMTYNNATFASLGLTLGTYVWSWGMDERTRGSRSISEGLGCPMAAQQFLCSVSVCSAWLPCGADWAASSPSQKGSELRAFASRASASGFQRNRLREMLYIKKEHGVGYVLITR